MCIRATDVADKTRAAAIHVDVLWQYITTAAIDLCRGKVLTPTGWNNVLIDEIKQQLTQVKK